MKLHPIDLLQYMCTYASIQMVLYMLWFGTLFTDYATICERADQSTWTLIYFNGAGAFLLNVVCIFILKKLPILRAD